MKNDTVDTNRPIEATLEQHVRGARTALLRTRIVGGILLAAMACWLTWLHGEVSMLDADGMATLAGERARAAMPEAAASLRNKLEASAPQLVASAKAKLLDAPAHLREQLESKADQWIADATAKLDKSFSEHMAIDIESARAELEQRYPGMDDRTQIRELMREFTEDYGNQLIATMVAPAEDTDRITREIAEQIEHLAGAERLTAKEQIQREMLVTLYQLVPRLRTHEAIDSWTMSWAERSPDDSGK
jgi:DNA-binding protein H-NS